MGRITIVAHRGLNDRFPENSLAGFKAAWATGLEWCECDIHLSADGVPMVIHDATLDRTTESAGAVSARDASALRQIRLRDHAGRVTEERLPSLQQVFDIAPASGRLLIEIKQDLGLESIEQLLRALDLDRCMIQSFSPQVMRHVQAAGAGFATAWLVGEVDAATAHALPDVPFDAVHVEHTRVEKLPLRRLFDAGKRVGVWTLNDRARAALLRSMGVDLFITDRPEQLVDLR